MAFYHLKMAKEYFEDVIRQHPLSVPAKQAPGYNKRIDWIIKDFRTCHRYDDDIRNAFNDEIIKGDIMFPQEISQKILRLNPEQRDFAEKVVDGLVRGEAMTVVTENENDKLNY